MDSETSVSHWAVSQVPNSNSMVRMQASQHARASAAATDVLAPRVVSNLSFESSVQIPQWPTAWGCSHKEADAQACILPFRDTRHAELWIGRHSCSPLPSERSAAARLHNPGRARRARMPRHRQAERGGEKWRRAAKQVQPRRGETRCRRAVAPVAGASARSGDCALDARAHSSATSVALATPALARSSPSTAEWLSESCERAPSRWSLLDPRVLAREQLTEQGLSQCLCRRA
jgi:hypothetical protein